MPLQEKQDLFGSGFAARRKQGSCEGKRVLPARECSRVIHGLRHAVSRDGELYRYIEDNLLAYYEPLSPVASAVNWRVGHLEKELAAAAPPPWLVGEYGARMVRQLCHRPEHECSLAGLALELGYAYLDGLIPVKVWRQVLTLLGRMHRPLVVDGLETGLTRRFNIQPERPILMPTGIGESRELYRIDPVLYRQAALLVQDWQRGCAAPRPRRFS